MLKFNVTWDSTRVNRDLTEECIGFIRREPLAGFSKARFYPIPGALDASELLIISEYLKEENRNGL